MSTLSKLLFPTASRVEAHTAEHINEKIARETRGRLAAYKNASPATIAARLDELDREWDVERVLQTNAGTLAATGAVLALTVDRKFAWISAVVGTFLVQHALQGWCPPLPFLRRAGIRTAQEINAERIALLKLRGDFSQPKAEPEI